MKKKMLLAIAAIMTLTSCIHDRMVFTKEEQSERKMKVSAFESLEVKGSSNVLFSQADTFSVTVSGPKSQVENVVVQVSGKLLTIGKRSGKILNMNDIDEVTVKVTGPDLISLILLGSGDFECLTPLDTDTLRLILHGSGDISFAKDIVCDHLDAELLGSGDLKVKHATTQMANLRLTGSGELEAGLKDTQQTNINLMGSGDVEVNFDNCVSANCALRGSGDIELSGNLEHLSEQKSGSGDIDKEKLTIKK